MNRKIDEAFVLAAGLGTRMRPLTLNCPKPLITVGGVALIDHMLAQLTHAGVRRFVVNVHYCAEQMIDHLKKKPMDIIISDESETLLETGGGLKKAAKLLSGDPIFVANTDSLWIEEERQAGEALSSLISHYFAHQPKAALLLARMENSYGFDAPGDFFLMDDKKVRFRNDAPSAPYNFTGVHITTPDFVTHEQDEIFSLSRLWRALAPQGEIDGVVMDAKWLHVGDPLARDLAESFYHPNGAPKRG